MSAVAVAERSEAGMLSLWSLDAPVETPAARAAHDAVPTLADAIDRSWSTLEAGFASDCMLCGGVVHPRWSAGAGVVGGRCSSCGSDLD